jgi:hypothetical protein
VAPPPDAALYPPLPIAPPPPLYPPFAYEIV